MIFSYKIINYRLQNSCVWVQMNLWIFVCLRYSFIIFKLSCLCISDSFSIVACGVHPIRAYNSDIFPLPVVLFWSPSNKMSLVFSMSTTVSQLGFKQFVFFWSNNKYCYFRLTHVRFFFNCLPMCWSFFQFLILCLCELH